MFKIVWIVSGFLFLILLGSGTGPIGSAVIVYAFCAIRWLRSSILVPRRLKLQIFTCFYINDGQILRNWCKTIESQGGPGSAGVSPGEAAGGRDAREKAGNFFGTHFPSQVAENTMPVDKKRGPGTHPRQSMSVNISQSQSTSATGASQSGVRPASRNHPSSCAGDQDDMSSQANFLEIHNFN